MAIAPPRLAHRLLNPDIKLAGSPSIGRKDEEPTPYFGHLLDLGNPQRPPRGTVIPAIDSRGDERVP